MEAKPTGVEVLDIAGDKERIEYLRGLGVKTDPPLVQAQYIRIKATGAVHPWTPLLAGHPDLCENCDVNGDTRPEAWLVPSPVITVAPVEPLPSVQAQMAERVDAFRQPEAGHLQPDPPKPRHMINLADIGSLEELSVKLASSEYAII
jgi:hypothetical protein